MAKKIRIIPELDDSKILKQLRNLGNRREKVKVDVDSGNIRNANQQMQQLVTTTVNSNTTFKKLKNTISNTFSSSRVTMTAFLAVLHEISKAGKEAKETIQDIDKAITDLSIATNMSREATAGLVKEYNNYAKELKSTTLQIASSADDYLRAGKSMSETKKLIEDSVMLSKLGQLETPEATEDLLATMNGFEMSVEEVGSALDAMVAIDMKAATSAGDIATALKYSASSADMAGLSFNKLASMIGTVQDKTQQSAETVGTFMNTLLSRYRNVKIGQFVSDDGEDLSEVETILKSLDIKLRDSNQKFRNFEMVIDEVALKWDTYSSVQQSAIAKAFSGTRQQNRFIALMEGYGKVLELTEVAANSAGTALEKFNNSYKNSLEAKQNTLQASFESMVMNSDMEEVYSGILEATTALVDFINHTNALKGVMTGLAVSGGVKGFLTIRTAINESYIALNQFSNALKIVKQTNISTADFDKLQLLTKNLSDSQMKMVLSSNALGLKQKELLLVNSGLSKEEAQLQLQTWGLTTAQTGLTVATTTLGNAFKGLWATLVANPFMILTMAISGLTMAYQVYNQKLEETRQKNIEASESAIDHANRLKDLYNEYSRLSTIQNRSGSEEEEFKTIVEDVTKALGDKAKALEGLTVGTNEYADALANATKEELRSASVDATIGRKSAEEELQTDIWSEWSGSKVSVDSNSSGQSLSEEAQRAVDIVSDVLKEFETINKTWNNLSWDITSDNPEKAFEFYNALIKARENLVLASESDEALLDTEIYADMNTAISEMSDSLDSYITKRYEEEKLNYMASNGIPHTTEEYKAMQDSIVNTASASVELQDKFKSLLMSDFSSLANEIEGVSEAQSELEDSMPDGEEITSTIATSVKQIATQLEPQFAKLGEAYQKIFTEEGFKPNVVDNSMLEGLRTSFADIEEDLGVSFDTNELEKFFDVLGSGDFTAKEVQKAFDDLATSWFYGTDILEQLNNETADAIEQQLEQLGVTNAQEVVEKNLRNINAEKEYSARVGKELTEATYLEASAFIAEQIALGNADESLYAYYLSKCAVSGATVNTLDDCRNVLALAKAAGISGEALSQLASLMASYDKAMAQGNYTGATVIANEINKMKAKVDAELANFSITDIKIDANTVEASKAGKSSADAYLEAFEKELKELQGLRDNGEISEKEYLDRLRALYTRYFKDRERYLNEFRKYESEYLSGMKSLYDSALSGITSLLSDQIEDLNDKRDEEIEKLEEQKEKAVESIQEQIDAKEAEIKAIQKASEQRQNEINLQQKQYALAQKMNQRPELQYKGGQFVYTQDLDGIRDAREELTQAEEEIEIARIESEIDSLETKLDGIEKYYDSLIKKKNAYYDQEIKFLEQQKEMWDDFLNMIEMAEVLEPLKALGISTGDILSGNTAVFETFKNDYLAICSAMNSGNQDYLSALSETSGKSTDELLAMAQQFKDTGTSIGELGNVASNVSMPIKDTASAIGEMSTNSEGVSEDINSINTALDTLSGENKLHGITDAFQTLLNKIDEVAIALGTTTEAMETSGGLIGAIQSLNEAQISTELLDQFTALESAINGVTTAIGGGADTNTNLTDRGFPSSTGESKTSGSDGSGGGLSQALEEQVEKAKALLPQEIDLFSADEESLLSAVTKVTTAIAGGGTGESGEKKEQSGEAEVDTSHLVGAIEAQYNLAEEKIPVETTYFTELATAIEACVIQLKAMVETLENMPSATISIGGGVSGGTNVNGTAHYEGTANVRGNWGIRESGRSLVGELGQEIVVRDGKFFTVGDNGAEFVDLQRGDIVFNHIQTKSLLKNGYVTGRGNAYANGSVGNVPIIKTPTNLPPYLRPLREGDRMYDLLQKMDAHRELLQNSIIPPVNSIQKNAEIMARNINHVNNRNTSMQDINININGGINLQGVQDPDALAKAINQRLPNSLKQELFKRK